MNKAKVTWFVGVVVFGLSYLFGQVLFARPFSDSPILELSLIAVSAVIGFVVMFLLYLAFSRPQKNRGRNPMRVDKIEWEQITWCSNWESPIPRLAFASE